MITGKPAKPYDAQLAAMNELAKQIWPDGNPEVFYCPYAVPNPNAWVEVHGRVEFGIDHKNALDALHAALSVMASSGSEASLFESGRRFQHACDWYTWQEQLARDLEVTLQSMASDIASIPLRACIQTLRERGQGTHP